MNIYIPVGKEKYDTDYDFSNCTIINGETYEKKEDMIVISNLTPMQIMQYLNRNGFAPTEIKEASEWDGRYTVSAKDILDLIIHFQGEPDINIK